MECYWVQCANGVAMATRKASDANATMSSLSSFSRGCRSECAGSHSTQGLSFLLPTPRNNGFAVEIRPRHHPRPCPGVTCASTTHHEIGSQHRHASTKLSWTFVFPGCCGCPDAAGSVSTQDGDGALSKWTLILRVADGRCAANRGLNLTQREVHCFTYSPVGNQGGVCCHDMLVHALSA